MTQNRSDSILKKSLTDRFQNPNSQWPSGRKKEEEEEKKTTRQNYRNPSHETKLRTQKATETIN